jgi:transposase
MCTVHNIKKIADFKKREDKNLEEILNMITGRINEWGNIMINFGGQEIKFDQ